MHSQHHKNKRNVQFVKDNRKNTLLKTNFSNFKTFEITKQIKDYNMQPTFT